MHGWWWSEGGDGGGLGNSTDGGSQKALGPVDWAVIVVHLGLSIVVGLLATRHSSKDGEVGAVSYHGRNGRCVPPFPPLLFHSPAVRFTRSPLPCPRVTGTPIMSSPMTPQKNPPQEEFFLAGRSQGGCTVAVSLVSGMMSGISFLGGPAYAYTDGAAMGVGYLVAMAASVSGLGEWARE